MFNSFLATSYYPDDVRLETNIFGKFESLRYLDKVVGQIESRKTEFTVWSYNASLPLPYSSDHKVHLSEVCLIYESGCAFSRRTNVMW